MAIIKRNKTNEIDTFKTILDFYKFCISLLLAIYGFIGYANYKSNQVLNTEIKHWALIRNESQNEIKNLKVRIAIMEKELLVQKNKELLKFIRDLEEVEENIFHINENNKKLIEQLKKSNLK